MILKAGVNISKLNVFLFLLLSGSIFGQYHDYGKITFERKTNLLKKYAGKSRMMRFVTEENKIKIDKFELVFNDTSSAFTPIKEVEEGRMGWLTTKNSTINTFRKKVSTPY
jgi:hypothetical protein